jgi:hypothetical protein
VENVSSGRGLWGKLALCFYFCCAVTECVELVGVLANRLQVGSNAVIRVYDEAGNVIQTQEHKGEFKEW